MLERLADKWDDLARDAEHSGNLSKFRGIAQAYRKAAEDLRNEIDMTRSIGK